MLITIPDVLNAEQVIEGRRLLDSTEWVDGRITAGYQARSTKNNAQIPEGHPIAERLGEMILKALGANPLFISAALPLRVFPPMFNRYVGGQAFGTHVDTAIRQSAATAQRIRTDISATLFFSSPEEYEGGELNVEDTYGIHSVKLPAGHMVLYPGSSLHHVRPVTRGARVASFFWVQSMIRQDIQRTLLFDLDQGIQRIAIDLPEHPSAVQLTGVYHNLLRQWAEV